MSDRENSEMEIEEAKETDTRTESTSMEETKGQDTDLRTSEYDGRTDWRHERDPRSSGEKREYPVRSGVGDCYYYLENGGCFFGRSCRFNHPPRNQMADDTVQPSANQVRLGATNCQQYLQTGQCSYGSRCWFNHPLLHERNQMRHEMVQPGPYPGARNCEQYLQTGQCSYGRRCRFNHPPTHVAPVLPDRVSRPICKYFQKGGCKHGSSCQYDNSMRGDGVEPTCQATTWVRRHETELSSRAEKRARNIPGSPERDPRESDDVMAGQNSWLQRRQAQENVQRGNIDCAQRKESWEERTPRERQAHDLEEQKQRERVDGNLRIDQIKATVQSDGGTQTEQRLETRYQRITALMPKRIFPEQADMKREKRETQEKAQEERSRSLTENVDQLGQFLQDIGIERKEGDGF